MFVPCPPTDGLMCPIRDLVYGIPNTQNTIPTCRCKINICGLEAKQPNFRRVGAGSSPRRDTPRCRDRAGPPRQFAERLGGPRPVVPRADQDAGDETDHRAARSVAAMESRSQAHPRQSGRSGGSGNSNQLPWTGDWLSREPCPFRPAPRWRRRTCRGPRAPCRAARAAPW